jgi:hypothetical protein
MRSTEGAMSKVVNIKQTAEPAGERAGRSKAIADAKRKRGVLLTHHEHLSRAEEYLQACSKKVEQAAEAVTVAKQTDVADIVKSLQSGGKVAGIAAIRSARQAESEAQDEFDNATAAHKRLSDDLRTIPEGVALATNQVHTERNKLISDLATQLVMDGEALRRRTYVVKSLLSTLLAASTEAPVLEVSEPVKLRCQSERDQPVAEARELVKSFMLANVTDADRAAGETAAQQLRFQLSKLLEDASTEISTKETSK